MYTFIHICIRFLRDSADAKQVCAEVGAKHGKTAYQVAARDT